MFGSIKEIWGGEMKKITMSIAIIFLCLTSVIGTTWALFTSGNDGKIGINSTSGYIDLDIVDVDGNSLVGDVLDFETKSDDGEPIYFEPGATFYTQGFTVKNNGNITINYRLYISSDEGENMESFNEAFELWVTDDPNSIGGENKITEFVGTLNPGETGKVQYLVIKMKESAGNDFQGKTYTGIGITVYAVQGNVDMGTVALE